MVRRTVLVAVVGAALITSTAGPAGAQAAGDAESSFVAYVNAVRSARGMSALPMAADLVSVARAHSADMAAASRLFHSANLGQQVQQWIAVAENVGAGATVDQIDQALMASSVHRGDILNPRYTDIGVGVVSSGGTLWLTEIFRQRADTAAEPATPPPPTSPPVTEAPAPAPAAEPAPVAAPPTTATAARPVRTAAAPVRPRSTPTTATPTTVAPPTTEPPVPEFTPAEAPAPAVVELAAPAAEVNLGAVAPAAVEPTAAKPALVAGGLVAIALLWLVAFRAIRLAVARRRPAYLHRVREA